MLPTQFEALVAKLDSLIPRDGARIGIYQGPNHPLDSSMEA